jgi:predicted RND superfamily exporter protein
MARREALMEACPVRLRPILMTSLATIAGALPAAVSLGPGAELRQPMATAVVGGMIVSTALTLFAVPSAYYLFDLWLGHHREAHQRAYAAAIAAPPDTAANGTGPSTGPSPRPANGRSAA